MNNETCGQHTAALSEGATYWCMKQKGHEGTEHEAMREDGTVYFWQVLGGDIAAGRRCEEGVAMKCTHCGNDICDSCWRARADRLGASDADEDDRPDFVGFANALRREIEWSAKLHENDRTGAAASDQRAMGDLAEQVERVAKRTGFWPATLKGGG